MGSGERARLSAIVAVVAVSAGALIAGAVPGYAAGDPADVTLTKAADAGFVDAGAQIGFTVTARNSDAAGTDTALGVRISDPLPGGSGVSWSIASQSRAGSCTIGGAVPSQVLSCGPTNLAPGASVSVHVVSATTSASCKTYSNTASARASNQPDIPHASAATTVQCSRLSAATGAIFDTRMVTGDMAFFVTASATSSARGVRFTDRLPAAPGVSWGVFSLSASCSISGRPPAQVLSCDLAPGGAVRADVESTKTTPADCHTYTNTVTVTALNAPSETAQASQTILCPDLRLTKTPDAASAHAGSQIGFTVTATNNSPQLFSPTTEGAFGTAAAEVVISDPLPGGPGISWRIQSVSGCSATAGATGRPEQCGDVSKSIGRLCAISGTVPHQVLKCAPIELVPKYFEFGIVRVSLHLVSSTTSASCGHYANTASLTAVVAGTDLALPSVTAHASTAVACPAKPAASAPPSTAPSPQSTSPIIATTGITALPAQLLAGIALFTVGSVLLALGGFRRRRRPGS